MHSAQCSSATQLMLSDTDKKKLSNFACTQEIASEECLPWIVCDIDTLVAKTGLSE
jgi:hypothetical protein